jgi:chlorobactene glucosyltransferase
VTLSLLLVLPWIAAMLYVVAWVRLPRPLDADGPEASGSAGDGTGGALPFVSVVIPARDEAHNIERVVATVAASDYPDFEIVVVDDRSADGTAGLARAVPRGNARRILVVDGEPLPDGWLGKPWACRQGARWASGSVLLFTDADTVHGPDLLARAVSALRTSRADAVPVVGRQLMGSVWERLVQPQVFVNMVVRFRDQSRPLPPERWRDAIANGQYILLPREVYDAIGGHAAVKSEVVEDLRLAQILVRGGRTLEVRRAEESFATRMYRDLGELVRGWSKNIVLGGLQTLPPGLRPFTPPAMLLSAAALWLAPPLALVAALLGVGGSGLAVWAVGAVGVSLLFWCLVTRRFGAPWAYGLLYPLGSAVVWYIVLRSWTGMGRVEWKGRQYRAAPAVD